MDHLYGKYFISFFFQCMGFIKMFSITSWNDWCLTVAILISRSLPCNLFNYLDPNQSSFHSWLEPLLGACLSQDQAHGSIIMLLPRSLIIISITTNGKTPECIELFSTLPKYASNFTSLSLIHSFVSFQWSLLISPLPVLSIPSGKTAAFATHTTTNPSFVDSLMKKVQYLECQVTNLKPLLAHNWLPTSSSSPKPDQSTQVECWHKSMSMEVKDISYWRSP